MKKTLKNYKRSYIKGNITHDQIYEYLQGWMAYAKHANVYNMKKKIAEEMQKTFPDKIANIEVNKLLKMQKDAQTNKSISK